MKGFVLVETPNRVSVKTYIVILIFLSLYVQRMCEFEYNTTKPEYYCSVIREKSSAKVQQRFRFKFTIGHLLIL